ncbi:MAG: hypothetical protein IIU97_07345, partial [Bacteroidaceae bacterium]|nr:hypothetical protein [Bacteroidaceae bacterium]
MNWNVKCENSVIYGFNRTSCALTLAALVAIENKFSLTRLLAALTALRALEPAPARHSKSKFFLCSRLLAALTALRALEPAPARHSKSKFFLCSRLLAALTA